MIQIKPLPNNYFQQIDNPLRFYKICEDKERFKVEVFQEVDIIPEISIQREAIKKYSDESIQKIYDSLWYIIISQTGTVEKVAMYSKEDFNNEFKIEHRVKFEFQRY